MVSTVYSGHTALVESMITAYRMLVCKERKRAHLGDLGVNGRRVGVLNYTFQKSDVGLRWIKLLRTKSIGEFLCLRKEIMSFCVP
jgi:hypothetical protein